jgi:hypothetical protein
MNDALFCTRPDEYLQVWALEIMDWQTVCSSIRAPGAVSHYIVSAAERYAEMTYEDHERRRARGWDIVRAGAYVSLRELD